MIMEESVTADANGAASLHLHVKKVSYRFVINSTKVFVSFALFVCPSVNDILTKLWMNFRKIFGTGSRFCDKK